jgi:hypothetical protein
MGYLVGLEFWGWTEIMVWSTKFEAGRLKEKCLYTVFETEKGVRA